MRKFIALALVLGIMTVNITALAQYAAIGKTTDNLRLREEPSLSARVLTVARRGDAVTVTQKDPLVNACGAWYAVLYNGTAGFMSADFLEVQSGNVSVSEIGYIVGSNVNFRSHPSTQSARVSLLPRNTRVEITGLADGWYSARHGGRDGYIRSDLVTIVNDGFTPAETAVLSTPLSGVRALSTLDSIEVSDARRSLVESALTYLGTPYRYGSAGPNSFDCSGFTSYIFRKNGYAINRSSRDQFNNGTAVAKGDLIPGDLVFFNNSTGTRINHVGIYIGSGDFIHSSSGSARAVTIHNINVGTYRTRYTGARRIL